MRCGHAALLALAFVCSVITVSPLKAEYQIIDKQVVDRQLFIESIHILGGFNNRVPRWSEDIRLAVVGDLGRTADTGIDLLMTRLSLYSGLGVRRVKHSYKDATQYLKAINASPPYDGQGRFSGQVCLPVLGFSRYVGRTRFQFRDRTCHKPQW